MFCIPTLVILELFSHILLLPAPGMVGNFTNILRITAATERMLFTVMAVLGAAYYGVRSYCRVPDPACTLSEMTCPVARSVGIAAYTSRFWGA